jgi:hypothetical protein
MKPILFAAALASLPMTALAFNEMTPADILKVNPISETNFEVIDGRFSGPRPFWCAAGLYVQETLGQRRGRIYIAVGRGPSQTEPGRKAVQFTTVPFGDVGKSYSVSIHEVGHNLGIGHAYRFCDDYFIREWD